MPDYGHDLQFGIFPSPDAATADRLEQLSAAVDLLTDTLLSHLSYEERELLHPLATYGSG